MTQSRHWGSISLAVLLTGLLFIVLVFTFMVMSKQAKASEQLTRQVVQLQNDQFAAGVPVNVNQTPSARSAKTSDKTKTYTVGSFRFKAPANLIAQSSADKPYYLELATKKEYFGSSVVPATDQLWKVKSDVQLAVTSLADYRQQAPYAIEHQLKIMKGRQVLILKNQLQNIVWYQVVIATTTSGPYHFVTIIPGDTKQAETGLATLLESFEIAEE